MLQRAGGRARLAASVLDDDHRPPPAIDRVRATNRARRLETRYAPAVPTSDDLQTLVVDKLYSSAVTSPALLALTPKQREALRLTYWDGRTAAEAAALLGIPVPTLKSRIHGAITRLRELLDDQLAPPLDHRPGLQS